MQVTEICRLSDFASYLPHRWGFWNSGLTIFNNKWLLACRNETSRYNKDYFQRETPKHVRWERYCPAFIEFDKDFNFLTSKPILHSDNSLYEDVRLFNFTNKVFATGTIKNQTKNKVDQFLAIKVHDSLVKLPMGHNYPLHQKNWTPIIYEDKLFFEQNPGPTRVLLKYSLNELIVSDISENKNHLRGNCQTIKTNDGYLIFYHYSKSRDYYHLVGLLDNKPPFKLKKLSKPFKFSVSPTRIQFLTGAELIDETVYLSYGIQDSDNAIVSAPLSEILKLL